MSLSYQRWGGEGFDFYPLPPLFVGLLNAHWRDTNPSAEYWHQIDSAYAREEQRLAQLRDACWCPPEEGIVLNWQQSWSELGQALSQEAWEGIYPALTLARYWELRWESQFGTLQGALHALHQNPQPQPPRRPLARRELAILELEQWQLRLERCRGWLHSERVQQLDENLQSAWGLVGAVFPYGMTPDKAGELANLLASLEILRGLEREDEDHRRRRHPATIPWVGYALERALEDGYESEAAIWLERFQQRWSVCSQGLLLPARLRQSRVRAVERAIEDGLKGDPQEFAPCVEHLAGLCQTISQESLQPGNRSGTIEAAYLEMISQILAGTQPDVALDQLLQETQPHPDLEASCEDYLVDAQPEVLLEAAEGLAGEPMTGPAWLCPFCGLLRDVTDWRCACGVVRPQL